jgi:outer membrane protein
MNKISPILNIILIVAVAVLFYFQFSGGKSSESEKETKEQKATEKAFQSYNQLRVAYVNIDSLLSDYDMYEDKRDEFVEDQSSSQAELQNRSQRLQQEFQELKEKLSKGLITRAKARMMQQELGQKEQELYQLRNNLTSKLAEKEQVIYRQVLNSVMDYMEGYADKHNYHYVLSYSFGGPVLYSAEKFDVTRDVLKGLNKEYNKKQKEEK